MKNHKQELEHTPNTAKPILSGFLIGSAIGAATALLFAPRSGEETRAEIRDKTIELRDHATETVRDTVSQAKSKVDDVKGSVQEKVEELKQRGKYTINRQLDRVSHAAETGKQKVQEY
ncbi:MAG: YtxH domain-containing protein [Anaerolineales bacterium]|nr:YtxH domain-containing protein [Anaerolineales bacterium]